MQIKNDDISSLVAKFQDDPSNPFKAISKDMAYLNGRIEQLESRILELEFQNEALKEKVLSSDQKSSIDAYIGNSKLHTFLGVARDHKKDTLKVVSTVTSKSIVFVAKHPTLKFDPTNNNSIFTFVSDFDKMEEGSPLLKLIGCQKSDFVHIDDYTLTVLLIKE
jgi:hypothetical protein